MIVYEVILKITFKLKNNVKMILKKEELNFGIGFVYK